jgi:hypothetical protein
LLSGEASLHTDSLALLLQSNLGLAPREETVILNNLIEPMLPIQPGA